MQDNVSRGNLRKKGDLNESVYRTLKDLILSGKLRPGNRLHHQDLADQLSVSRTPVRESLERLYQEGYAGRRPRRGYYVAELDAGDVEDLYETREALEAYALRKSCGIGLSKANLAELRKLNATYAELFVQEATRERLRVDREFHMKLASLAQNPFLCRMLESVFEKIDLKRRLDGAGIILNEAPMKDHKALVTALAARQYKEAEEILRRHIRQARLRLLQHLELSEAGMP
jgi:DNA-binding GntR family transcriptional regulator